MDKKRGLEGVGEGLTPSDWSCRSSHNQLFRTYWRKSRVYLSILNFTKTHFSTRSRTTYSDIINGTKSQCIELSFGQVTACFTLDLKFSTVFIFKSEE